MEELQGDARKKYAMVHFFCHKLSSMHMLLKSKQWKLQLIWVDNCYGQRKTYQEIQVESIGIIRCNLLEPISLSQKKYRYMWSRHLNVFIH